MIPSNNVFYAHGFGAVAPWMDLANSEEWDGFGKLTDHLTDSVWLSAFLSHWDLRAASARLFPRRKLLRLRSLLRRAAEKLVAGQSPAPAELAKLNRALNVPVRRKFVQNQNGFHVELVPENRGWNWVIARIAASLGEMLTTRDAARIKICANSDCRWIFYDPTKARIKRWCNDRTCGNRARVRRARAAHR